MNDDWLKLSPAAAELVQSCGPDETAIWFGDRGLVKLPIATWCEIYWETLCAAVVMAATQVGGEARHTGGRHIELARAAWVDDDWEIEAATVTVRLRGSDGDVGVGVAHLQPPSVQ
jgi:hypothetical protein